MIVETLAVTIALFVVGLGLAPALRERLRASVEPLSRWLGRLLGGGKTQSPMQHAQEGRALIQEEKWPEALAALDRALALVEQGSALKAELHFERAQTLEHMRRFEEAIADYAACRLAEPTTGQPKHRDLAAFRQGHLLAQLSRWQEAELSLQECLRSTVLVEHSPLRLSALRILLGVYQATRRHEQALQCAREVERLAREQRDEPLQALALDMEGDIYLALGESLEALHRYEQSLDLFRKQGNVDAESVVKRDIARLYRTSGQWDKAARWLGVCLKEEQSGDHWAEQARITYDLGCLHIHAGHLLQAGAYLQRSMALFRQAEDRSGAEVAGRTLMGLSILMHRQATAGWLTFGDLQRGSAQSSEDDEE